MDVNDDCIIPTYTGFKVNLRNPDPATIDIRDIAHGLSCEARFNGHTREFYSVAQHSVFVSHLVPKSRDYMLEALLHDATEAYMKDLPAPLKAILPEYKAIETRLDRFIQARFDIPPRCNGVLKFSDGLAVVYEALQLMPRPLVKDWPLVKEYMRGLEPISWEFTASHWIPPLPPKEAEQLFIERCKELGIWEAQ